MVNKDTPSYQKNKLNKKKLYWENRANDPDFLEHCRLREKNRRERQKEYVANLEAENAELKEIIKELKALLYLENLENKNIE